MNTIILTDSSCDLSREYLDENGLEAIPFPYTIGEKGYVDDFGKSLSYDRFYDELRHGAMPSTSQISVYNFEKVFRRYIDEGKAIIYIGFSSALSQTFNNSILARNNILDEIPDANIAVIDSKSASIGLGAIVFYANNLLKNGKSYGEIIEWVENNKLRSNHWFIIDSLDHLKRGGRISAAAAAVGSMLDVKPMLNVDDEGKLNIIKKIRGRKKALKELLDKLQLIETPEEQVVFINHADCAEDAEHLKELVMERVKVKDVVINNIGPIIGSHTGPGMICLVFMGEKR